ncbi:SDR family oxidoreductase [Flavobacterium sp. M31R6]|uniref:SDR family NAD(P)-dependent oxidoreductase n=1 Tax=Flavobacterium sp. M31R6 TaxID=2739062 RepID=UPI00156935D8|nr:SDR family oxidoreductase [Flavobacterium sp. M31R6]QKJ64150.1 SDR family oxidoreductase [Flavobacterium sp. M31R6]
MKKGIQPVDPNTFFENRFQNKVLLITGAAINSIGGCTAIRAAKEGAKVVCVDIKKKELNETIEQIKEFGGDALAILADISKVEECNRIITETIEKYGKLDLVLNAAGVMDGNDPSKPQNFEESTHLFPSPIHNATDEYWDLVMKTNITGMFYAMRAQLNQFLKQDTGGAIVNIGSIAGIIGLPGNAAYSASKHAVIGLTRNAAIDYAPNGIRVNSVNMAQTDTPMVFRAYDFVKWAMDKGMGSGMAGGKSQSLLSMNDPNGRGSTPWEQAAIILFLLSDDASNITGATIATDGGWTTY